MKKTMHKWFWVWEFEKEEKWLNSMAEKGLVLESVGFCTYHFIECVPGEYSFKLEFLENLPSTPEGIQYIEFIEETGAEYIGAYTRWVYFRKKTDKGSFDLFSDSASRIKHLNRILTLLAIVGALNLFTTLNMFNLTFLRDTSFAIFPIITGLVTVLLGIGIFKILSIKKKIIKESALFE